MHLHNLQFDNRFIKELPSDPEIRNFRRQVVNACYSYVQPTQVQTPELVAYSSEASNLLDLSAEACESNKFLEVFSGNHLLSDMQPYATCYGGHQFGNWAGQLGDGRAINLGEVLNTHGQRWALQLKGSGLTPYSRNADGLAVLRSSIREFLCSEAMYHLGVPTTRALSVIATGEQVTRDMFYDGNPKLEPGAVVCRMAPSFTRFGSFQIFAAQGNIEVLQKLLDYTLKTDFNYTGQLTRDHYINWFAEVCRRTAHLIIHWQRVGFVHGVMNTDNMSILGLTIDYGPYGWLDNYDPQWTPNTTDASERRYRYEQQPEIALWNLVQLANAIYPLINSEAALQDALTCYTQEFEQGWLSMMQQKLGIEVGNKSDDLAMIQRLLQLLQGVETDMSIFFRNIAYINSSLAESDSSSDTELLEPIINAFYHPQQLTHAYQVELGQWLREYVHLLRQQGKADADRIQQMHQVNPKFVLRNYISQQAIDRAHLGDYSMVRELLDVFKNPYAEQPDKAKYAEKRPDWARQKAGCSMLSCSS